MHEGARRNFCGKRTGYMEGIRITGDDDLYAMLRM